MISLFQARIRGGGGYVHTVRHAPCHHPPPPRQSGRKISRRKPPDANDRGSPACTRGQNTPSAGEYMRTAGLAPAAVTQCPRRPWLEQAFALLRKFYKVNMSGSPSLVGCAVTLPKNHPDRPLDVTRASAGGCSRLGSHRYAFFATANQPQDKLFSHRILNRQAEIRRCH